MTEKDKEIQDLRRQVERLGKENQRLKRQHEEDMAELVSIRRRYECRVRAVEEGKA